MWLLCRNFRRAPMEELAEASWDLTTKLSCIEKEIKALIYLKCFKNWWSHHRLKLFVFLQVSHSMSLLFYSVIYMTPYVVFQLIHPFITGYGRLFPSTWSIIEGGWKYIRFQTIYCQTICAFQVKIRRSGEILRGDRKIFFPLIERQRLHHQRIGWMIVPRVELWWISCFNSINIMELNLMSVSTGE